MLLIWRGLTSREEGFLLLKPNSSFFGFAMVASVSFRVSCHIFLCFEPRIRGLLALTRDRTSTELGKLRIGFCTQAVDNDEELLHIQLCATAIRLVLLTTSSKALIP